jgi:hypothetical protein
LDPEHVAKVVEGFRKEGISRMEPMLGVYSGDPAVLPEAGDSSFVTGITIQLFSGQHRLRAIEALGDDQETWWPMTLYSAGMSASWMAEFTLTSFEDVDTDSTADIAGYVLALNKKENAVGKKATSPVEWFRRLYDYPDTREVTFSLLDDTLRRNLKPLFQNRPSQVEVLNDFGQAHPDFLLSLSFSNIKLRAAMHMHRVSSYMGTQFLLISSIARHHLSYDHEGVLGPV